MESKEIQTETFRLENNPKRMRWYFAALFFFGITSLYFYISVMVRLNSYYSLLLAIPFYAYMYGQAILWLRDGVRAVEVSASGITLFRPRDASPKVITLNEIGSIRVTHTLDGDSVTILLHGATSKRFLGVELFSGPHFRISQGAFGKPEFQEFIKRVSTIKATTHN